MFVWCVWCIYSSSVLSFYCYFNLHLFLRITPLSPPFISPFFLRLCFSLSLSRFPSSALTHIRSFTQHMAHTIPSYISRTPRWEKFQATWHWWYSHALGSTEYITFYLSPLFIALSRGGTCSAPARWSKCWCSQATFVFSRPLAFLEFIGTDTK